MLELGVQEIIKFNRWKSVSVFINGLGYLNFTHMYYFGVFTFLNDMRHSSNQVLNSQVIVYIKEKFFCQQLALFNINMNMPIHVIRQLVIHGFNNLVI